MKVISAIEHVFRVNSATSKHVGVWGWGWGLGECRAEESREA